MSSIDPRPGVNAATAYEVEQAGGPRTRRLDALLSRIAGEAHEVPRPPVDDHAVAFDVLYELRALTATMRELRDIQSGELVAKPWRVVIDAQRPFYTFEVDRGDYMHAIQVDNPTAVTVELRFDGSAPLPGSADQRVPAHSGRILVREFNVVSIGMDPAVIPAGQSPVFVTVYSRPLAPSSYAFAP